MPTKPEETLLALFDVNVLIALLDEQHVGRRAATDCTQSHRDHREPSIRAAVALCLCASA
jgi:hypothetical protein